MSYFHEIDAWLDALLYGVYSVAEEELDEAVDETKRAIKEKILESYRNGQNERPESARKRASEPRKPYAPKKTVSRPYQRRSQRFA